MAPSLPVVASTLRDSALFAFLPSTLKGVNARANCAASTPVNAMFPIKASFAASFASFSVMPLARASSYTPPASKADSTGLLSAAPPMAPRMVVPNAPSPTTPAAAAPPYAPTIAAGIRESVKGTERTPVVAHHSESFIFPHVNSLASRGGI